MTGGAPIVVLAALAAGVVAYVAHRAIPRLIEREGLRVSPRWASVLAGGVAAFLVAIALVGFGLRWVALAYAFFAVMGVLLADVDLRCRLLPNPMLTLTGVGGLLLLAVASAVGHTWRPLLAGVISAAVLFVVFLVLATISPAGIGMGDVKLAAIVGLALGFRSPSAVLLGVLAAFILGGCAAAVLLVARRAGRRTMVPFGPFMIAGAVIALIPALEAVA